MTDIVPEFLAPCGLYCGVCQFHYATQANDLAFLERFSRLLARQLPALAGLPPEELLCDGCLSARRFPYCRECAIRDCAQRKGLPGCHQCGDFPCALTDAFPIAVGRKVMLRAVPYWRAHGTEAWIRAEEARYRCPECGHRLARGARQCRHCQSPVDVD
jgi:hypothetical protein